MNVVVIVQKQMVCDYCINDYIWSPNTRDFECNKAFRIDEFLDVENFLCEKSLFDQLILTF